MCFNYHMDSIKSVVKEKLMWNAYKNDEKMCWFRIFDVTQLLCLIFIVDSSRFLCIVQKLFGLDEAKERPFIACEKPLCQILSALQSMEAQKYMKNRNFFDENGKKRKKKKNFECFRSFQMSLKFRSKNRFWLLTFYLLHLVSICGFKHHPNGGWNVSWTELCQTQWFCFFPSLKLSKGFKSLAFRSFTFSWFKPLNKNSSTNVSQYSVQNLLSSSLKWPWQWCLNEPVMINGFCTKVKYSKLE